MGAGWGRSGEEEMPQVSGTQSGQTPLVRNPIVPLRTQKKVSVVRCLRNKRLLSASLCLGPCAEHQVHKDELG